jgi:suppressor for copper-sensitivity B
LPGSIASVASQRAGGPMLEAFVVGVFATLLATPCSAPFVGIAVGFCVGARAVRNLCNRRVFSASE